MLLIKQFVLKNYQKYVENELNNRYFPFELGYAVAMSLVVLEEEKGIKVDQEIVDKINDYWKKYCSLPYSDVENYSAKKYEIGYFLEEELKKLEAFVLKIIKEYADVEGKDQDDTQYYSKGVVMIKHPFYKYG